MSDFAQVLSRWRKSEGMRQSELAVLLGVTQQAVSLWERGHDLPDPKRRKQIQALMAKNDELAMERRLMREQSTIRALFDLDQMQILAVSKGFVEVWPSMAAILDRPLRSKLVNEASVLSENPLLRTQIAACEVFAAKGVSFRHFDVPHDPAFLHRWFVRFRKHGTRMIGDMLFEQAEPHAKQQVEKIYYVDEI